MASVRQVTRPLPLPGSIPSTYPAGFSEIFEIHWMRVNKFTELLMKNMGLRKYLLGVNLPLGKWRHGIRNHASQGSGRTLTGGEP